MSEETKIQWAEHTGGPYLGCSMVSPGCVHCYSMGLAETRLEQIFRNAYRKAGFADWETRPVWGDKATRVLSKGFWDDARRINAKHEKEGTRGRWFPSMIDWLDTMQAGIIDQDGNKLDPIEVLARFLKLIHDCKCLDFLLLTKRPENFEPRLREVGRYLLSIGKRGLDGPISECLWLEGDPPRNVWIGVSVEDQQRADERIPALLKIPAKVRFLSVEPLLGPVDLERVGINEQFDCLNGKQGWLTVNRHVDWVIVGGESGLGARPCNVDWIRDVVRQCQAARVPLFCKQLGSVWAKDNGSKDKKGGTIEDWPSDLQVRQFPV